MKTQGVNRVYIIVKDIDKAVSLYSDLLGVTFHDAKVEDKFGVKSMISWDAGIEMLSPVPGSTSYMAQGFNQFLETYGEGLYGVAFSVANADEAHAKADQMGLPTSLIQFDQDEIRQHFQDRFKIFKEYVVKRENACGVEAVLAQIEPK